VENWCVVCWMCCEKASGNVGRSGNGSWGLLFPLLMDLDASDVNKQVLAEENLTLRRWESILIQCCNMKCRQSVSMRRKEWLGVQSTSSELIS
jgi:hypothetical protein